MAVNDVVFQEGDRQGFILETATGTFNPLVDVVTQSNTSQDALVEELIASPAVIAPVRKVR